VPYVSAEIESRARAIERDERLARLREAEVCLARPFFLSYLEHTFLFLGQKGFTKFVSDIELYEIVSKSERELYGKNASAITDPARRRETKIKQYQAEKEIRSRIEVNSFIRILQVAPCGPPRTNPHPFQAIAERRRVPLPPSDISPTDFDLIAALLPPSAPPAPTLSDDEDSEDDRRTATLLLLRLTYAQAHAQLLSITQELEILRTAPPPPPDPPGTSDRARSLPEADRTLWTLDAPRATSAAQRGGTLLNSAGKVCDPWCFSSLVLLMGACIAVATVHNITFWRAR
jgi:hypothetical protein